MRERVQGTRSDRDSDRERGKTETQEDGVTEGQGKEGREGSREGASKRAPARAQEKEKRICLCASKIVGVRNRDRDLEIDRYRDRDRNRDRKGVMLLTTPTWQHGNPAYAICVALPLLQRLFDGAGVEEMDLAILTTCGNHVARRAPRQAKEW